MIPRLTRFLRQLRPLATTTIFIGDASSQHGYRFPVRAPEFKSYVVEPDGHEHWVVHNGPNDWSDPSRHRQHQFGAHPDVPFEGLAQ